MIKITVMIMSMATDLIKIINISIHSKYLDSLPFDLNILIVRKEEKLVELKQA